MAIQEQNADGCLLQNLSLSLSTVWEVPPQGNLPFPTFSGAVINYAIGNSALNIQNLASAPTGFFECDVNLEGSMLTQSITGINCDDNVSLIADRLDDLNLP
jgi:hypothetical protein